MCIVQTNTTNPLEHQQMIKAIREAEEKLKLIKSQQAEKKVEPTDWGKAQQAVTFLA